MERPGRRSHPSLRRTHPPPTSHCSTRVSLLYPCTADLLTRYVVDGERRRKKPFSIVLGLYSGFSGSSQTIVPLTYTFFPHRNYGLKTINKVVKQQVDSASLPHSLLNLQPLPLALVYSANQHNLLRIRCLAVAHLVRAIPPSRTPTQAVGLEPSVKTQLVKTLPPAPPPAQGSLARLARISNSSNSRARALALSTSNSSNLLRARARASSVVVVPSARTTKQNQAVLLVLSAMVSLTFLNPIIFALTVVFVAGGTSAFGGGGAFGTNQQQQQPATTGLFGQPQQNTGAFGVLGENLPFM